MTAQFFPFGWLLSGKFNTFYEWGVGVFSVRLRYQVLDESTLPKKPAELTITIADASGARIHTWNLGYLQRKTENEGK